MDITQQCDNQRQGSSGGARNSQGSEGPEEHPPSKTTLKRMETAQPKVRSHDMCWLEMD